MSCGARTFLPPQPQGRYGDLERGAAGDHPVHSRPYSTLTIPSAKARGKGFLAGGCVALAEPVARRGPPDSACGRRLLDISPAGRYIRHLEYRP